MAPASSRTSDRLRLAAAAVLFSTGGAAIKATALTGWQVACFRSGVAALAVALLVPAARRGWNRRVIGVSAIYAATMVLFVVANKTTTAANAIFLQATAPIYVLALAPWLLRERVTRVDVASMAAVAVGLVLVLQGETTASSTAPNPRLGNALGLASGVCWALTMVGLRWLSSGRAESPAGDGALSTVVGGNVIACLACLPLALPLGDVAPADAAVVGYLGVFQIGLAYLFLTRGIRGVPAVEASMLLLVEPALNPLWAWLLHREAPGLLPTLGGALILASTVARARAAA